MNHPSTGKPSSHDTISCAASVAESDVDKPERDSSNSSVVEKDTKPSDLVAPEAAVPHLSSLDGDDTWIIDAQAGAVGAGWKHRIPALLMVLFFTRTFLSIFPLSYIALHADVSLCPDQKQKSAATSPSRH